MISGIVPLVHAEKLGFPWKQAILSWMDVCDEIICITFRNPDLSAIALCEFVEQHPKLKLMALDSPKDFETYRFLGYHFCSNPNWVVHFDADYIISPSEALKLRETILKARYDTDIITYTLTYLNYNATKTVYIPQLEINQTPRNGYQGEYPLIVNPRRQMFICNYAGVTQKNVQCNYESVMCLRPGDKWGKTYNTKFLLDNPYQFNILRTDINVEHLSFSLDRMALAKKLSHQYWVDQMIDMRHVITGYQPYNISYPLLDEARKLFILPS